jgi:hypothetical protein
MRIFTTEDTRINGSDVIAGRESDLVARARHAPIHVCKRVRDLLLVRKALHQAISNI